MHIAKVLAVATFCHGLATALIQDSPLAIALRDPELEKKAVCGTRLPVNIAYQVISVLKLSAFCTTFNRISTKIVPLTTTATTIASASAVVTTTLVIPATTSTTITTQITETVTSTSTAPEVTSTISVSTTVFTPVTFTSTTTSTTQSTSTTYIYDVQRRKRSIEDRGVRPKELIQFADDVISSACSCYAKTPTVTIISTATSTSTYTSTSTSSTSETSFVSTATEVETSTSVSVILTTITPIALTTSIRTLTQPTTVGTVTRTATRTLVSFNFVSVILIPIQLSGCIPVVTGPKFTNVGNTFDGAAIACASRCIAAGKVVCDDFYTAQNLQSGNFDCFLLSKDQQVNTNFVCSQPNVGQAAEWIIIY